MKVTLLGDSIRARGYGTVVPTLLGDSFEVYQPGDNCRFVKYTLRGLFDWEENMKGSRIVHWNNGLWDVTRILPDGTFSTKQEFLENTLRVARILTSRYEKVIYATTTPIHPMYEHTRNSDIEEFNSVVVPEIEKMGIIINDLYSLVYPNIEKFICEDKIHLNENGIAACGEQVAQIIKETALTLMEEAK